MKVLFDNVERFTRVEIHAHGNELMGGITLIAKAATRRFEIRLRADEMVDIFAKINDSPEFLSGNTLVLDMETSQ